MQYWLRVSGTNDDPVKNDWQAEPSHAGGKRGERSMFSRHPTVKEGDRLVLYAAGSPQTYGAGRFYAVVQATTDPMPRDTGRWPWEVETAMVVAGGLLENCPTLDDIGVKPTSVRRQSHIRITHEQGVRAEELLGGGGSRDLAE
jgi:hypothetical protein